MGLQAQLTAQLTTGPSSVGDNAFPSGVMNIAFGLNPPTKQYGVATGSVVMVSSPSSFQPIDAIGVGGQVLKAQTLYVRSPSAMILQLTFADPGGGADLVVTEPIDGVKLS